MADRKALAARAALAFLIGALLFFDLSAAQLFVKYSNFKALSGADGGLFFDPYSVRWRPVNRVFFILNLTALASLAWGIVSHAGFWKFRFLTAFALLANALYPNLVVLLTMTGFHLIPFSIMLVHGGALFAWMFFLVQAGPPKPRMERKPVDDIREIDVDKARDLLESGKAVFVDIRDPASYEAAHVPAALSLNDANIQDFVKKTEKTKPVVVYCYHGHTSQGAAAYLMEQGFQEVYSVIGGFERWRQTEKIES